MKKNKRAVLEQNGTDDKNILQRPGHFKASDRAPVNLCIYKNSFFKKNPFLCVFWREFAHLLVRLKEISIPHCK